MAKKHFASLRTQFAAPATAQEIKEQALEKLKKKTENSKILENNSQILESKAEFVSPAKEKVTLTPVLEQAATQTETAQGEAQSAALPDTPKIENNLIKPILGARLTADENKGTTRVQEQGTTRVQENLTRVQEQGTTRVQTRVQENHNKGTQQGTTRVQTRVQEQGTTRAYSSVTGNLKLVLDDVLFLCAQTGSLNTPPMRPKETAIRVFGEATVRAIENVRKCWTRLSVDHALIKRTNLGMRGKFTIFEVGQALFFEYKSLTSENLTRVQEQGTTRVLGSGNKGTQQGTQQGTNGSSKIDSNFNNNLTNYPEGFDWFKQLDFKPIDPIRPMQVNQSIRTLVVQSLSQDQAQDFINRFQSWAATQGKINNPLAFFCDKLKEFASNKDSAVLSHKTEDERKFEAQWAQKMEQVANEKRLSEAFQIEESFNRFLTENPDLLLKEIEKIKAENAHTAFKIGDQIVKTMAEANLKNKFKLAQTPQG